jgi:hypothetical protein
MRSGRLARPDSFPDPARFRANRVVRRAIGDFFPTDRRPASRHAFARSGNRSMMRCSDARKVRVDACIVSTTLQIKGFFARALSRASSSTRRVRRLATPPKHLARAASAVRDGGKFRRGLLTRQKTVIRFRRKQIPAEASESKQHDNEQQKTDLRPGAYHGGCRFRFPRENARTHIQGNPRRSAWRVFYCRGLLAAVFRIRPGAHCASAVGRGSDSRDVASNWAVLAKQVH